MEHQSYLSRTVEPKSSQPPHYARSRSPEHEATQTRSLFRPGRNVWRIEEAEKASFLIDADAFYKAFIEAAQKASSQLIIVGWDTHSQTLLPVRSTNLMQDKSTFESGEKIDWLELGTFLKRLVQRKPTLSVHVLCWDYALIYAREREALPGVKFSTLSGERLRFVLDRHHPFGASHHQKIVVIDNSVAFCGGLDITQRRWDTREHLADNRWRVDPAGRRYGPFHDIQICLKGNAASALGDLARERWRLATGESLPVPSVVSSPWPDHVKVDVLDVEVGIARTEPIGYRSFDDDSSKPLHEVERLFLDSIRLAKKFIYVENQYFTSPSIAKSIARRLRDPQGPEVVMILPRDQTGWLEESTMGVLRSKALKTVMSADKGGRFRCFHPTVPNLGKGYLKVHSKTMIVDDLFLRIGSANLNCRSMGLDTECDIAIEARGRKNVCRAIARLRAELLGEHLGVPPSVFEQEYCHRGSLLAAVEVFRGGSRDLVEILPEQHLWIRFLMPPGEWIDPRGPKGVRRWISKRLLGPWTGKIIKLAVIGLVLTLSLLAMFNPAWWGWWLAMAQSLFETVAKAWEWIRSWDTESIAHLLSQIHGNPLSIPIVVILFVVGSVLFVPVTAMLLGVALVYPPWIAFPLALSAALTAAFVTYEIGRYWAWSKSHILSRPWVVRLSKELGRGGVWVVALIRLAPIAPFTAVNIVSGGLRISLRDFILGSMIGLLPGILALTLLSQEAARAAKDSDGSRTLWVFLTFLALFVVVPQLLRRLRSLR